MTSLIKLKMNHKATEGRKIPWELLYMVRTEDVDVCDKLFKYFLVVTDAEEVKKLLNGVKFTDLETRGMSRDDYFTKNFKETELKSLINTDDYSIVVPILAKGKKRGKKFPRYFTSKQFRRAVRESEKSYDVTNRGKLPKRMPKVLLKAGKDMEGHPCANCRNLPQKILDDRFCTLGSAACIQNIVIGNGSDFNTSREMPKEVVQ